MKYMILFVYSAIAAFIVSMSDGSGIVLAIGHATIYGAIACYITFISFNIARLLEDK